MAVSLQMSDMDSDMKALRNKDRIILNVGGIRHETFKSTLRNFPDTRLAWITTRDNFSDYDPEKNEYFFDRHPGIFQQIMNFYRTGKLHCPSDVCGPLFEEELNFWGIDEKQMEPCCWSTYTLHREAQENLKVFNGPDFNDSDSETEPEEWKNGESTEQHRGSNTPAWQRWRSRIWTVFEDHTASKLSKVYVWVSLVFVVVSVISLCANTDSNVAGNSVGKMVIIVIDKVCGVWFTAEFLIRCFTCPNIIRFSKQFLNWIDFLAIIPFYLNIAIGANIVSEILVLGRMLRLLRFFNKMSLGFQILKHTLVASSKEMFLLLLLVMIPVLLFAGILHLCESGVSNTKFKSIPEAFWWAIITLTTVGYGDMAPLTTQGKIFGSICAGVSMLISALPISIIGANFSLYYRHAQAKLKLPKKPRKVLIGAANTLLRNEEEEAENSGNEKNSSDDLTTEVYLGPKRLRRERMSLFCNGVVAQRNNSRIRSLGGDHLPGQSNHDVDETNFSVNSPDYHKSSLLSTSTKSTIVESPPPRSVSFPANLPGRERSNAIEPGGGGGHENSAYRQESEDGMSRLPNGSATRSFSAGSRYKRNGVIYPMNAPRVTVTADVTNQNDLSEETENNSDNNESEHKLNVPPGEYDEKTTNGHVTADNKPLTIPEGMT